MKIRREAHTIAEAVSPRMERNMNSAYESLCQKSSSSSSLPEIFGRKLGLSTNNILLRKSIDTLAASHEKEGPFGTTEIVEAQTLGILLPDDDDLFSGMVDELVYTADANEGVDAEDFDLFSHTGGMELEVDNLFAAQKSSGRVLSGLESSNGSLENGSIQFLHSASSLSHIGLQKNLFNGGISSLLSSLASPVRVPSAHTCFGLHEENHFLDQVKLGNKCVPSFHPSSVPDSHNGFDVNAHNSSRTATVMAGEVGANDRISVNERHVSTVGSADQALDFHRRVPGLLRNGARPTSEHCRSNANLCWHNTSSPQMWSNSPLFLSDIRACSPQLSGLSGMPTDKLSKVLPPHNPYVGSAPSASWSLLDRKHTRTWGFPESLDFSSGSFGSEGFVGHYSLHLLGRDSYSCSHAGGNCTNMSTKDAWCDPHQMSHIFPSRNGVTLMPTSFSSPPKCAKNLSHRRSHSSFPQADSKHFELEIDRVLHGEDNRTTLMIKNIPNKYTSKMLLAAIDEQCQGKYDFIYLPIDFKNNCNVGYAFINLIDPLYIIPFYKAFNGRKWDKFNSEKVVALAYARIQGKAALIAHFQNSSLMNEDKRCRPILFHTNGPNAGEQEPFPMGTANLRAKAGKAPSNAMEVNHQQTSPSTLEGALLTEQTLLVL